MYIIKLQDLKTKKVFDKVFYDNNEKRKFLIKCKYSKKIQVVSILEY